MDRGHLASGRKRAGLPVRVTVTGVAVGLVVLAFCSTVAADPIIISATSSPATTAGNGSSSLPSVSADGQIVAFESEATNLVEDDHDFVPDVFVRQLQTGQITLASRADGQTGSKGGFSSHSPSISADGRYVAFTSGADLVGSPMPGPHVFVRDLVAGTTVAVDRQSGVAGEIGNGDASAPVISGDGGRVAFVSTANNLDPGVVATPGRNVYVRDLQTHTTTLVSRASGIDGQAALDQSQSPSISADGGRIAFSSYARNLAPDQPINPDYGAVYVRDLNTAETILVSRQSGPDGRVQKRNAGDAEISANGDRVAFLTTAFNLHPRDRNDSLDVYVRDLTSHRTIWATRRPPRWGKRVFIGVGGDASLSANGRTVAFSLLYEHPKRPRTSWQHAAVRDLNKREPRLVDGARTMKGPFNPVMSTDARWLAFESDLMFSGSTAPNSTNVFAQSIPAA
jgi:Tol biopolymer transport system component